MRRALVTGAGGFIGGHLVDYLVNKGYYVRGVDIVYPHHKKSPANEFMLSDLRKLENCRDVTTGMDEVYNLAANMGGIGYIYSNVCNIIRDNYAINLNMAQAIAECGAGRMFYSSSACIYPMYLQKELNVVPLKEEDAYPADPEPGYGWEKLIAEQNYMTFGKRYGYEVRIARFHNIAGIGTHYDGGREKAPAAICRKVAMAEKDGTIKIWGDGKQERSYCYIKDCVEGIYRLMQSDWGQPLNIGYDHMINVDELVTIIEDVAGKKLKHEYELNATQGVRSRNSDNSRCKEVLGWCPTSSPGQWLPELYQWVWEGLNKQGLAR